MGCGRWAVAAPGLGECAPSDALRPAPPPRATGSDLWDSGHHAKPQRPRAGWSYVVHDTSDDPASRRPTVVMPPSAGGVGAPHRPLGEPETYLQARRTPKPRRRYFFHDDGRRM